MSFVYNSTVFERFQRFSSDTGYMDNIYKALEHDDVSELVLTMLQLLKKSHAMPEAMRQGKCAHTSKKFRMDGNIAYNMTQFRKALQCYNKALLYAPKNTEAMILAYSNRSALLFTNKAFKECLNDIEIVFSMGCNDQKICERLYHRRSQCASFLNIHGALPGGHPGKYFEFNVPRNLDIPCVHGDVQVVREHQLPKIIARKDIQVGTVVAIEPPFACNLNTGNLHLACHYCHKMELNLIPCDNCCHVLFCDTECKEKCLTEFHTVECQIIENLENLHSIKIRAVLKMRQMCNLWDEFIEASHSIGEQRMKNSSLNEIFDVNSKFSLLNFSKTRHFVHGEMYNTGFVAACDIYHLEKIQGFLPSNNSEREEAIRAISRIMLYLGTSYVKIPIKNSTYGTYSRSLNTVMPNYGWFAFTSKLKHCCDPNLIVLGLRNNVALVAVQPIKKGSELTISYLGHWYEDVFSNQLGNFRQYMLFRFYHHTCSCRLCMEGKKALLFSTKELTMEQRLVYDEWNDALKSWDGLAHKQEEFVFDATCTALQELQSAAFTPEHHNLYKELRGMLGLCQYVYTNNVTI